MPVKYCRLSNIRSAAQFYREIAGSLAFPPHFGDNLDALWDVLANDVAGPVDLTWRQDMASRAAMGADFEGIARVLREVAAERDDFDFRLEE